jgi:hypothetical protein
MASICRCKVQTFSQVQIIFCYCINNNYHFRQHQCFVDNIFVHFRFTFLIHMNIIPFAAKHVADATEMPFAPKSHADKPVVDVTKTSLALKPKLSTTAVTTIAKLSAGTFYYVHYIFLN